MPFRDALNEEAGELRLRLLHLQYPCSMSSRGIFAICLVVVFFSVLLVPVPNARHLFWTFTLWSLFAGSVIALAGIVANVAGVLALMYFGSVPGRRGSIVNVLPFISRNKQDTTIQDTETPNDLLRDLDRIADALSDLKSTLAFHRLSEEQRHQYDRAFAELEVLIQQVSVPMEAKGIAS